MIWEKSIFLFLKKFPNPNIAKAYNYYENSDFVYLILELVNGTDLKEF
jgi:serine/threonine protein kinase